MGFSRACSNHVVVVFYYFDLIVVWINPMVTIIIIISNTIFSLISLKIEKWGVLYKEKSLLCCYLVIYSFKSTPRFVSFM